jgi:transposase
MLIDTRALRIFVYKKEIYMTAGIEKLLHFIQHEMKHDPDYGYLYLFFGKRRNRLKALYYDGTGLILITKRLEYGRFMPFRDLGDLRELNLHEFEQIFHGGHVVRPRLDKRFSHRANTLRVIQNPASSADARTGEGNKSTDFAGAGQGAAR